MATEHSVLDSFGLVICRTPFLVNAIPPVNAVGCACVPARTTEAFFRAEAFRVGRTDR